MMKIDGNDIGAVVTIGAISAALFTTIALTIRASFVRSAGGSSYFRGWKDGIKEARKRLDFCEPPDKKCECDH